MDELSVLHLGHKPIPYDEVTGTGRGRLPFAEVPLDRATAYAAEDADVTLRLHALLRPRLRQEGALALYEEVERRMVAVLRDMEAVREAMQRGDIGQRVRIGVSRRIVVRFRGDGAARAAAGTDRPLARPLAHAPERGAAHAMKVLLTGGTGSSSASSAGSSTSSKASRKTRRARAGS